eukprot:2706681-Amphidinium_carterae.1
MRKGENTNNPRAKESVTSPMTNNMEGVDAIVWPSEHQASRTLKTATGEICTSEGRYKVKG